MPSGTFSPLNPLLGTVADKNGILAIEKIVEERLDVALSQQPGVTDLGTLLCPAGK